GARELSSVGEQPVDALTRRAKLHDQISSADEASLAQLFAESRKAGADDWTAHAAAEQADPIDTPGLLRTCAQRPRGGNAAEHGQKIPSFHVRRGCEPE